MKVYGFVNLLNYSFICFVFTIGTLLAWFKSRQNFLKNKPNVVVTQYDDSINTKNIEYFMKEYNTTSINYKSNHKRLGDFIKEEDIDNYEIPFYEQYISNNGAQLHRHKVVTKDGYINTLWRLFKPGNTKPVILSHGLLDNAFTFFALERNRSLPFMLLDQGYDVWLTNTRGSMFSHEHLTFDSWQIGGKYWNFTFIEIAKYDLQANIDFVIDYTGKEKLDFVGHSQGGFTFILMYALNPNYLESKINSFTALGTVPNFIDISKKFPTVLHKLGALSILKSIGIENVLSIHELNSNFVGQICDLNINICSNLISSIIDNEENDEIDYNDLKRLYIYEPGGSSIKNLIHWLQNLTKHKVTLFDYGSDEENLNHYGSINPEIINLDSLGNINFPCLFFLGDKDPYTTNKSIDYLKNLMKNNKHSSIEVVPGFNHLAYIWAKKSKEFIFDKIVSMLNSVN